MNLYYIQINLLCLILLTGVRYIMSGKHDFLPAKALAFNRMIFCCMAMCVSDMFAWVLNGAAFPGARVILEAANIIYYSSVTWTCFTWLIYVRVNLLSLTYDHKRWMKIAAIPLLIMTLIIVTNPLTHLLYRIDENANYERGNAVFLHWIISWGYLIAATLRTFSALRKAKTKPEKLQILPMLWFIVMPVIAAVAQMIFYGVTTMQCGVTLSAIMISANVIHEQIATDPLTGLNNRRSLDNYIAVKLEKPDRLYSVILIDIDKFKSINDILGHAMGDIALKRISSILKEACGISRIPLFLCRYGGDEFVLCATDLDDGMLDSFFRIMNELLETSNAGVPEEQRLTLSIGKAEGRCTTEKQVGLLIQRADSSMYDMKKTKGVVRA